MAWPTTPPVKGYYSSADRTAQHKTSASIGHALASDGLVAVLFGGDRLGLPRVNDTWAWYDETWRQIQDIGPSPRAGHAMANVTSNDGDQITLFGGEGTNAFGDTWRLEDRS